MRSAKIGDHFVLLIPTRTEPAVAFAWQRAFQRQFGGDCTDPLHVSLQRFTPADPVSLTTFAQALRSATATLPPLALTAVDLRPLYSRFRDRYVLKCRVALVEPLQLLSSRVQQSLVAAGLKGDYRRVMVLVTVLEGIMRPITLAVQPLPTPLSLFVGGTLVISRITGPEMYEELFSWSLNA